MLMRVARISWYDSVGRGRFPIYIEGEAVLFFLYCNVQKLYPVFYFIFHSELQCGYQAIERIKDFLYIGNGIIVRDQNIVDVPKIPKDFIP
jgi:hypothetical protein